MAERRPHGSPQLSRARSGRRSAFTLIELTLVVAAIAILSAIAIPRYSSSLNRYRVEMAAKRLVADFALARSAARASATGQVVNFATPTNGYTLTGLAAPDGRTGDYVVKLGEEPYKVTIGSIVFGTNSAQSVRFTRYGTPEVGGTIVLSSGSYQKTVMLDPVTGRAETR
jgi:prepilin-type N-terminal cleavage/methylation domain-containing protein